MDIEAIITAIIVSLDAIIFGILYGINKIKFPIYKLFFISIIPIAMSYPMFLIGEVVSKYISFNVANYICIIIFIVLSIKTFLEKNDNTLSLNIVNIILMGVCFGIDSSISSLTLAITGHSLIIIPIYFGFFHVLLLYVSNIIVLKKNIFNIKYIKYINSLLFLLIAVLKLM